MPGRFNGLNLIHELAPQPRLELDWRRYFLDFCHLHGGNPVIEGGRLLFQDGWMYSATDYKGPEWPPPGGEELRELQLLYWRTRKDMVDSELVKLERTMIGLDQMKRVRSGRIASTVKTLGEVDGQPAMVELKDAEAEAHITARISFLRDDVGECENKIKELTAVEKTYAGQLD